MKFKLISQCINSLDFAPQNPHHPLLAGYSWKGIQLTHHNTIKDQWLDAETSLEDIFKTLYPQLTLAELARFYTACEKQSITLNWESFFQSFQLKWSEDLLFLFKNLAQLSMEFQKWTSEKDFGLNELRVLNLAFKKCDLETLTFVTNRIAKTNANRHLGSKILEFTFINFNPKIEEIFETTESADKIYEKLYTHRYPNSTQKDHERTNQVQSFPWPSHIKAQWERKGDRSGVQVQFFSSDESDFLKKLEDLNKLKEKYSDLWK